MIDPKDNPPAFPCDFDMSCFENVHKGISMLDYFAAKAMNGMYASTDDFGPFEKQARTAYTIAEAMLAERKKRMEK